MFHRFLPILCLFIVPITAWSWTVVLDPGHGGEDTGAYHHGIKESKVALDISKELQQLMEAKGWKVRLTRHKDKAASLKKRVSTAKTNTADLFLSIHANASVSPKANGVEFYLQNQLAPDEESLFLANHENRKLLKQPEKNTVLNDVDSIVDDLKRSRRLKKSYELSWQLLQNWKSTKGISKRSRRIRQAPFYVITQNSAPSVFSGSWLS